MRSIIVLTSLFGIFFQVARSETAPSILVVLKSTGAYWGDMAKAAEKSGQAHGAAVVVRSPPTEESAGGQLKLLQTALRERHFDAVVIAPINPDATLPELQAAMKSGVKVIGLDRPQGESYADSYVLADDQAALKAMDRLAHEIPAHSDVVILRQGQLAGPRQRRDVAITDGLKKSEGLVLRRDIFVDTSVEDNMERIEFALAKYPACRAIVAPSLPSAVAALRVLAQPKYQGKYKLVGFGYRIPAAAIKPLEDGTLVAWVAETPEGIGDKAVTAALALIQGGKVPTYVENESLIISRENVKDPDAKALMLPE